MTQDLGMGGHCLPNEGISKVWLTPQWLTDALGPFDLDPCAAPSPRPWDVAENYIELPQDGLTAPWGGRVFLNPPYSQKMGPWLEKMADHGNGIALIFARTETELWHKYVWPRAVSILFLEGRLFFHHPDGKRGDSNAGAPSALIVYSEHDRYRLQTSGIKGVHIDMKTGVISNEENHEDVHNQAS